VDLISVSTLVSLLSKIFDGSTGKAGERLWDSLSSTVRRLFGRQSTSVEAVKRLGERPGDADAIHALAQALVLDAGRDPRAAAELRHWVASAQRTLTGDDHVANTISGEVHGNVVQARDIHGNITF
jgi:thioredoxin-like negative regulator of GroEL